ncbi:rhodanese-like domain-containing protein [Effusibacillus lacus]|uniref:Sulfurtransferase n=1 Tax=Effusibacillus lacus TaxID=1348429 RepID=A0A292YQ96_9BACL|nr:rhodanese-like domain-containing protein [Effusibacillus lacus]TCS76137.1 rhodanese-related sulfurtransferase [Effusibacillus lacus]GAX91356.1 sulfurtransferase [Effusibacillus lacus]
MPHQKKVPVRRRFNPASDSSLPKVRFPRHDHNHTHHHDDDYDNEFDLYPMHLVPLLNQSSLEGTIIDVREQWEYEKVRIEGSVNIPMRQLPQSVSSLNHHDSYYIVCSQGFRGSYAAAYLRSLGYQKVYNIQTGIMGIAELLDRKQESPSWLLVQ